MANRPVYIATGNQAKPLEIRNVDFKFYSGFSMEQKRRSIRSLHEAFLQDEPDRKILEISSKSEELLGTKLSAFNLMVKTRSGRAMCSVESAFQASKVFENGGPYVDLLYARSIEAKKDARIRNSGRVVGFRFNGQDFPINPTTYFYNWLYINALNQNKELIDPLIQYDAFTDIEFNPKRSLNCQAESVALFVSLHKLGLLEAALRDKESFLDIMGGMGKEGQAKKGKDAEQLSLSL